MTAITHRQKRLAKKGRPRIPHLARTEHGRISRTNAQNASRAEEKTKDIMATVIDMRQRLHGATGENAKALEWGYVLGRIWLDGNLGPRGAPTFEAQKKRELTKIGDLRLEAGNRYAQDMSRYYGLTGIPFPSARAQSLFSVPGSNGGESPSRGEAARKASDLMMALESAMLQCKDGRNAATTVKNVCVMDIDEARGWPVHMLGYLRAGLDALVWKYGLVG